MKTRKYYSCLFFGKKDDYYSINAIKFLKKKFFKVRSILSENKIGEKIDTKYLKDDKKYDYLFSFKTKIIIPKKLLGKIKLYSINFHNCLSRYPGSGGNFMSLLNNEKFSGITVHLIDEFVDNGKIFYIKKIRIKKKDNIKSLLRKINKEQFRVFKFIVSNLRNKWLSRSLAHNQYSWGKKKYRMTDINKLREIRIDLVKNDIRKIKNIIKASYPSQYPPYIKLLGFKFFLK
jgi:methionyl-tRNA formyltransferase